MAHKIKTVKDFLSEDISPEISTKLPSGSVIKYHNTYKRVGTYPLSITEVCITNKNILIADQHNRGFSVVFSMYAFGLGSPHTNYVDNISLNNIESVSNRHRFLPGWFALRYFLVGFMVMAVVFMAIIFDIGNASDFPALFILLFIFSLFSVVFHLVLIYLGRCIEISITIRNQSKPVIINVFGFKRKEEASTILKYLRAE